MAELVREVMQRETVPGAGPRLRSVADEARLFWWLRWRMIRSLLRSALQRSRLQLITVSLASSILWLGLFVLFFEGFLLVHRILIHEGLRTQLVHAIFNIFFLALTVMLVFSSAIILYGSLFRSDEVTYLLTGPVRFERIVWHKFQEAAFFSGWGFVLLASPMLLAYGIVVGAPWYYYAMLIPFVLSFVLIPAGIGSVLCLIVARLMPRVRMHLLVGMGAAVAAAGAIFLWRFVAFQSQNMMTLSWFQDVLARLEFCEQRLLPSWWLSSGLLEAAHPLTEMEGRPAWQESLLFLAVLASNALLLHVVLGWAAAWALPASYSNLRALARTRRWTAMNRLDHVVMRVTSPLPRLMQLMLLKDLRVFRRDPVQWSQFAIFFGLLSLYFFNVRRFDYSGVMEKWVILISFFNLAVVGLLLSTFTTRFIFPMISLEGRRFWVLGTAPIRRDTILWGKFCFACAGALPVCALLVLISDLALRIPQRSWGLVAIHQFLSAALCVGLSALAVGLGARLPNLRESSPSKIASGFGGTLNLVLSSLYILAVIILTAVPAFFWFVGYRGSYTQHWRAPYVMVLGSPANMAAGILAVGVLAALTTTLSLRVGIQAFRRLET